MRQYGDSLDKFEPNDLNQALVPSVDWFSSMAQRQVKDSMHAIAVDGRLSPEMEDIFRTLTDPTHRDFAMIAERAIVRPAAQQQHPADGDGRRR